jgi:hypothetical protein
MSDITTLEIYPTEYIYPSPAIVPKFIEYFGAPSIEALIVYVPLDANLDEIQMKYNAVEYGGEMRLVFRDIRLDDAMKFVSDFNPSHIYFGLGPSSWSESLINDLVNSPSNLFEVLVINEIAILISESELEIYDSMSDEIIARPTISIDISTTGSPANRKEYFAACLKVDRIKALAAWLEQETGVPWKFSLNVSI